MLHAGEFCCHYCKRTDLGRSWSPGNSKLRTSNATLDQEGPAQSSWCSVVVCGVNVHRAALPCWWFAAVNAEMQAKVVTDTDLTDPGHRVKASCAPSMQSCGPLDQGGTRPVLLALHNRCVEPVSYQHTGCVLQSATDTMIVYRVVDVCCPTPL
jgi:hypothetical protein